MALFDFTNKIIKGESIDLFNNGDMIRDFTYVDDIVNGINIIVDFIERSMIVKEIYNIGNGRQVPLMEFVDNIEKQLDRKQSKTMYLNILQIRRQLGQTQPRYKH